MPSPLPLLDRERTVAGPGFNRWLVPPAALCIHLCIGMAYGFSVFWLPLTRAVGINAPVHCPAGMTLLEKLTTTTCDWDKPLLGWMYTLFFVFLGSSAAVFGNWLEKAGPRKAGVVAACCWCGGLVISAAGIRWHQLWLVWLGSGVIGMASPMLQEMFGGRLLGESVPFEQLDANQLGRVAAMAAGFTGLLSLFNIVGRFFWSTLSDAIGRKAVYTIFFLLGAVLYAAVPAAGQAGSIRIFCGILCLILTMYGGGFAAIPAYLADMFGTRFVGAIHGRLLTAWSVAGILGPVLVNYLNERQVAAGVPKGRA